MIETLLAKDTGETLINHSQDVMKLATFMSDLILNENAKDSTIRVSLREQIRKAALLHDIGKSVNVFQDYVRDGIDSSIKYFHNQVSWAITRGIYNLEHTNNAIYWHHDNFENKDTQRSILECVSEEEIVTMVKLVEYLTQEKISFEDNADCNTPKFIGPDTKNHIQAKNLIARAIVISADRIISSGKSDLSFDYKTPILINKHPFYDKERFDVQLECANNTGDKTCLIKAPAGFGKTLTGILWNINKPKKLLWVCPRNVIVETVYSSIVEELKNLDVELSVEMYLTGERKDCTNPEIKDFDSDIVVTNIDNFINPLIKNSVAERSFSIFNRDVIFDEFQEFKSNEAFFAGFLEIMKARHIFTNSRTLLLTATPEVAMLQYWENDIKTVILPDREHHFKASHNKRYIFDFVDDTQIRKENNSAIILNNIYNTQKLFLDKKFDLLIHSQYIEEDKKKRISILLENYSKKSEFKYKPSVLSAPIIQASMDISFQKLTESICSPETTLQRIGRCNRWGEYEQAFIHFLISELKKEQNTIERSYDKLLNIKWIGFLKANLKENSFTLNEIYKIYNSFHIENEKLVKDHLDILYKESLVNLSKLYPKKFFNNNKISEDIKYNSAKSLRTHVFGYWCVYPYFKKTKELTPIFSESENIPRHKKHEEDKFDINSVKTYIHLLPNYEKYKYSLYKKPTLEILFKSAYKSDTPYIALNKRYCENIGLAHFSLF